MRVLRWIGAVCWLAGLIAYAAAAIVITLLVILPVRSVRGAVSRMR